MEASRVRNGSIHQGTLEIGRITARKVSVFSSTKTVISMKACGLLTADTDKALIGGMKVVNLEENTLEIGFRIRNMVEAHSSTRTETDTMDSGSMACLRVRVE
jgi:hypothetical protein